MTSVAVEYAHLQRRAAQYLGSPELRTFDPHQPRRPDGEWAGLNLPDVGNLFKGDAWGERYDNTIDERSVGPFVAIGLEGGETQFAFDHGSDRLVLAETDANGMRSFADLLQRARDDADAMDGTEENDDDNGLVDDLSWDEDDTISIGYDAAGDFKITKATGEDWTNLPELSDEEIGQLIEALHDMAQVAEDDEYESRSLAPNMARAARILKRLPDLQGA